MLSWFVCTAAGAAQTPAEQVEQAAREVLERQLAAGSLQDPRFELDVASARPAPRCATPLQVETVDTRQPARMRFTARCLDGAGWRHEFVVRARISAAVAVTAVPVSANQTLSDTDLLLERRDVSGAPDAVAPNQAVGQSSRRSLRAGEVLRASQLAAPMVVKRGDPVMMVARHEGIEVSMAGEALDPGARGAVIRVRNAASGQVVRMRVTAAGAVTPVDQPLTD